MAEVHRQSGWYYSANRRKVGPVTWSELYTQVKAGVVKPADMVLRDGAVKWVAAGSLPELIASAKSEQAIEFDLSNPEPSGPQARPPRPDRPQEIPSWVLQFFYYSMGLAVGAMAIVIWYIFWGK
jgi:hypothetical protein